MKRILMVAGIIVLSLAKAEISTAGSATGLEALEDFIELSGNPAWEPYGADSGSARFFKKNLIREKGHAKAWVITVMDDATAESADCGCSSTPPHLLRKTVALIEFACGLDQSRTLQISGYAGNGVYLGGKYPDDPPWGVVAPDDQPLYRRACPSGLTVRER